GGWLFDRFGPRPLVFLGGVISGLGLVLLGRTESFLALLLVYIGVVSTGSQLGMTGAFIAAINLWFIRHRTFAMSICFTCFSAGGAIVAPLLSLLIQRTDWRFASTVCGIAVLAVVPPLSLFVRRSPESMGLRPDGGPATDRGAVEEAAPRRSLMTRDEPTSVDFSVGQALKTPSYWLLTLGTTFRQASQVAVGVHMVPIAVWKGLSEQEGALLVSVLAFSAMSTKALVGWFGDRFRKQTVMGLALLLSLAALAILLLAQEKWALFVAAGLLASSENAGVLTWSLLGDFYGRRYFGTIRGLMSTLISVGLFAMPFLAGLLFDWFESYAQVLLIFMVSYGLGALIIFNLKAPRAPKRKDVGSPVP
ncbi:MAG: MFS transporter, partial [Chloroflexi bacterium]|nr:MFS transporter [Chloroflexota bacterium]